MFRTLSTCLTLLVLGAPAHAQQPLLPTAGSDRIVRMLVACDDGLDCWLARLLFPASYVGSGQVLTFASPVSLTLESHGLVATGESGGLALASVLQTDDLTLTPDAGIVSVPLRLERLADVPSDHYVGALRLDFEGHGITSVPVDLRVRSGPLWPLLFTLAGILIGLAAKYWNTRGKRQADLLTAHELCAASLALKPELQRQLAGDMEEVAELIYREELDQAEQRLTAVRERMQATRDAPALVSFAAPTPAPTTLRGVLARLRRRAWLTRAVLGPLLRGVLIVLLALVGLKSLYIEAGDTFGSNPLFDHLALFFWGIGAEVSTRSLTTIGGLFATPVSLQPTRQPPPEVAEPGTISLPGVVVTPVPKPPPDLPDVFEAVTARWPHKSLRIADLWAQGLEGEGTTIAVIDTGARTDVKGIDWSRVTSEGLVDGDDTVDRNGHGTMMIGILASASGLCPRARVLSICALDSKGEGTAEDVAKAVDRALALGCDIISISAGQAQEDEALDGAVARAEAAGVLVIGAVRKENPRARAYPAASPGACSVTPSTKSGGLEYPNPGVWVTIAAPGDRIPTWWRDGEVEVTGSSPAAAVTAGVCALLLSAHSGDARKQVARSLTNVLRDTSKAKDGGRLIDPLAAAAELSGGNV